MSRPSLRSIREQRNLTLREMADLIGHKGCDVPFLSRFERGLHMSEVIDKALLDKIGKAYGCRVRMTADRVAR